MSPLPSRATFDPRQPFTRAQGWAAGISRRALRGPRFVRLLHDIHISASVDVTPRLRAQVGLQVCGSPSHVSHHTAALLWRAWVPDEADIHVSVRRREDRVQRRGLRCHLAHPTAEVVWHSGLRLSSPAQTFLEMARVLGLVDLVVLGDSLVHRGHATPTQLVEAASRWRGHGAILARRAARLVRSGVESPMETRLRLLLVLAGLPEPTINVTIAGRDGVRRIRLDLSYPALRLAIEYDGRQHAESDEQWLHDIGRREDLDALLWRLIVVTSGGIFVEPQVTLSRVVQALHALGVAPPVLAPDDEWRRLFPGRAQAA